MPTQHEFYESLLDGRWQPEIKHRVNSTKNETSYVASYVQGDQVVERSSVWSASQAEEDLMEELRRGTLEGDYYPVQG